MHFRNIWIYIGNLPSTVRGDIRVGLLQNFRQPQHAIIIS